jgi:uncharacterized protein (UPF0335 family)
MAKKQQVDDSDLDMDTPRLGSNSIEREQLKSIVERYERLAEEKAAIAEDQKELLAEAKAQGYDTKILRKIIALRKVDSDEFKSAQAMMKVYAFALGMQIYDAL